MKVKREDHSFKKITITIENQDELNQLQGLCNYGHITQALPIINELCENEHIGFRSNKHYDFLYSKVNQG